MLFRSDILALADLAGGSIVVVSLYGSKVGREKCFAVGTEYDPVVGLAKLVSGLGGTRCEVFRSLQPVR